MKYKEDILETLILSTILVFLVFLSSVLSLLIYYYL